MCGIAGIWHLGKTKLTIDKLTTFTDSLSHRGPDDGSYWIDSSGYLGLGHRRLSILDLSPAGNQPMTYAKGRYKIIYNGEIFNFLELKKELETKKYQFSTSSDTEVILAAYDFWGKDCLNKFNGMWALAIWDESKQSLFLARDRFGIKPLYYTYKESELFSFASETYAFKFLEGFDRKFNEKNVAHNIINSFSLEANGHTIFQDIFQLVPGHYIEINKSNIDVKPKRWWNTLSAITKFPGNYQEQVKYFRDLFFDSVKLRLRSDVPIASALSGGLDSSSVYCSIYHVMNSASVHERTPDNWQQAFVATFPGTSIDEKQYAKQVIEYTKGKVQYLQPDYANLPQQIKETTLLFDSIYLTPVLPGCDVYRAMNKEGIKVSMDGHGVDEMLFGYPSMIEEVMKSGSNGSSHLHTDMLETILDMYSLEIHEANKKKLTETPAKPKGNVKTLVKKVLPGPVKKLLTKYGIAGNEFGIYVGASPSSLSNKPYDTTGLSTDQKVPFEAFHMNVLPGILRNFDRTSMQSSIEIRMPFMDYRLVSFVFSLPFTSKVGDGFSKRIVRDAMKGFIPESIRTRKGKIGFNAPMIEWFAGGLSEFIRDEIHSSSFMNSTIWNGKEVQKFAEGRIKAKSWTWDDCTTFWPVLNAHLIISNNKS